MLEKFLKFGIKIPVVILDLLNNKLSNEKLMSFDNIRKQFDSVADALLNRFLLVVAGKGYRLFTGIPSN